MNVSTKKNNEKLTAFIEGRVDTTTAPKLESEMKNVLGGINKLELNLKKVEYISSAGLRVILSLQKQMMKKGGMTVTGASDDLMEIFEVTGFSDILDIE